MHGTVINRPAEAGKTGRPARRLLAAALVAATTLGGMSAASSAMAMPMVPVAGAESPVVNVDHRNWRRHDRHDRGRLIGAGIAGLAAGAILGGVLSGPRYAPPPVTYVPRYQPYYYAAPPVVTYAPPPQQYGMPWAGGYPPYSDGWLNYCSRRYRSFDARSGTFLGYDGYGHYCR